MICRTVVLGLALLVSLGNAEQLWVDDSGGEIGKVDVATGAVSLVGNAGVVLTDIAFDPTGNLYGIDFSNLYRVNTATGGATRIGGLGVTDANALVFGSDGTLYTADLAGNFQTVNTATGKATTVGSIGFGSAGDLAFVGGSLYLSDTSDQLVKIDPSTGKGTLVGTIGVPNVFGLATPDNVTLYGVAGTDVYTINPTTGAALLDVSYAGHGLGTAFGESFVTEAGAPTPSPEPSTLLSLAAGLSFLALGVARRRRAS